MITDGRSVSTSGGGLSNGALPDGVSPVASYAASPQVRAGVNLPGAASTVDVCPGESLASRGHTSTGIDADAVLELDQDALVQGGERGPDPAGQPGGEHLVEVGLGHEGGRGELVGREAEAGERVERAPVIDVQDRLGPVGLRALPLDDEESAERLRRAVRRAAQAAWGKRPMVKVEILVLEGRRA